MKKILFLVFFVLTSIGYSQKSLVDFSRGKSNAINISLSSGISSPSSNFSETAFASSGSFIELSSAYTFSKIGVGLSLGQFTNLTSGKLSELTNSLPVPTINSSNNWKSSYFGIGPEYTSSIGNILVRFQTRIGSMSIKENRLEGSLESDNLQTPVVIFAIGSNEKTSATYFSSGINLGYSFASNLTFFINMNYLSALSDDLVISTGRIEYQDINKNGVVDAEDFIDRNGVAIQMITATKNVKPQTLNYGIGLTWNINAATPLQRANKKEKKIKAKAGSQQTKVEVRGWNPKDKTVRSGGVVVFTNPSKEKADKKEKLRKLINVLPKNNSNFNTEKEIKNFSWKVIGERIMQPQYIIEISKIGNNHNQEWILIAKTTKPNLSLTELFKQNSSSTRVSERLRHKDRAVFTDGNYQWKVTETTTGTSSNQSYFTMTQCELDFSIANEEIECLGYEQENRKFKICFDVTYTSASGDLTYVNSGTGLSVYDQTYAALSYTLVSPNPTLVTQIGATTSTVSYCFEVTVSASVTSIGFGLQGDDLDPSPIVCQPGVSSLFDELPSCLCDECEEVELSFDDFNITPNAGTGNQFNFNGNINVNVPIYGIEFQVQSYSYTANPSACTEGVSSVEESGMILMPGTSINGSTALQLFNETVSGSASSNDNATKDIKYTSNTPLTGPIPINLTIGLPGPISGLDPSCCVIDYTVCIKVKIFYEEGNCKSCVFTHCFEFNNQ